MILWDVNLWVYAFRGESPLHEIARSELQEGAPSSHDGFLFCPHVAASFLRLVTNPRIFAEPSSPEDAWAFVDALESRTAAVRAEIDPMAFGIFKHLCIVSKAAGSDIPDALLASLAIRHGATLVTADRRFERFDGLGFHFLVQPRA